MNRSLDQTTSPSSRTDQYPVTILQPSRGWVSLRLDELWAYRELLYFLTWRDITLNVKTSCSEVVE